MDDRVEAVRDESLVVCGRSAAERGRLQGALSAIVKARNEATRKMGIPGWM